MRKTLFTLLMAAFLVIPAATAFGASQWDFYENWNSWPNNAKIEGIRSPNPGTWARYCAYTNSYAASTYSSSSYVSGGSGYTARISTYPYSSYEETYMQYTFPSGVPTPRDATISFYYYSYYVICYFECYDKDGALLSTQTISSTTASSYYGSKNFLVPAGTSTVRWHVKTKRSSSYSYCLYIDEIFLAVPEYSGASDWDLNEDFNSLTSNTKIEGIISPNPGTWVPYCSYTNGNGATAYTSYASGNTGLDANIGTYPYSASASSHLSYTFPGSAPTPADATISFYWYSYRVNSFFQCFNASGTQLASYAIHTSSYSYRGVGNFVVPAGTAELRWYVSSKYSTSSSYALYVDEIRFRIATPVKLSAIGGDVTTGFSTPVGGKLAVTASVDIDPSANLTNQSMTFYYMGDDEQLFYIGSDNSSGSGIRSILWDTGNISKWNGRLWLEFDYHDTQSGTDSTIKSELPDVYVYNPILESLNEPPALAGGFVPLGASFDNGEGRSGTYPPNPWYHSNTSNSYASGYTIINSAYTTPQTASFQTYTTYFYKVANTTSARHRVKIASGSPGKFTVIANGPSTLSVATVQSYSLEGVAGFDNIPAGSYIGCYYYYTYNYYYAGNANAAYYCSGDITATASSWNSNSSMAVAITLSFDVYFPLTPRIEFAYSGNGTDFTSIGVATATDGMAETNWNTEDLGNTQIYVAARAYNGNMWSNWHVSHDKVSIVNFVDVEFDTSLGDGYLTFEDEDTPVSFTKSLRVSWASIFTYNISAPEFLLVVDQETRWAFDSWTGGDPQSHDFSIPSSYVVDGISPRFVANYKQQYFFTYSSPVEPISLTEPNQFYDKGATIYAAVPQAIPGETDPERTRQYCYLWEAAGSDASGDRNEATFTILGRTHLTFYYREEMAVIILNHKSQTTGTLPGFYPPGTSITLSVNASVDNDQSKLTCLGYTTSLGGSGIENYLDTFTLTEPFEVSWLWTGQHYAAFSANMGTVELEGGGNPDGWYNDGAVLSVVAYKATEPDRTEYRFGSWTGATGAASALTLTVDEPVNAVANWDTYYELIVNAANGTFAENPSGFILAGSDVAIDVLPPTSEIGERWVVEWSGDSPAVTLPRKKNNPTTVNITMTEPVTQNVAWLKQYLFNVVNTNSFASVIPAPGYNWFYPGTEISGFAQYSTSYYVCDGFNATGSLESSVDPFFSFVINSPTYVEWLWTDRTTVSDLFWQLPIPTGYSGEYADCAVLPNGDVAAVYFSADDNAIYLLIGSGATWTHTKIAGSIQDVSGLDIVVSASGEIFVAVSDTSNHTLYLLSEPDSALGSNGWAATIIDDFGIVGRSVEMSISPLDGSLYICYLDDSNSVVKVAHVADGNIDIELVPADGIVASLFCSISTKGIDGLPVVSFYDSASRGLVVSVCTEDGWETEVVDNTGICGFFCQVQATMSGGVMVAYQDVSETNVPKLKFARKVGDSWTIETADDTPSGYYLDFKLDSMYNVHIISSDGSRLQYSHRIANAWETEEIPKPKMVDGWISLAFSASGKPVVLYTSQGIIGYIDGTATELVNINDDIIPGDDDDDDDDDDTPTNGSGGGGGCFIATAAFGSMISASVCSLTQFRDTKMDFSASTSALVKLYYTISPNAAAAIANTSAARAFVRTFLVVKQ